MTPKELTKKQKNLAQEACCPFCGAQARIETHFERCENLMMREFRCNHCDKQWYNEYTITFASAYQVST